MSVKEKSDRFAWYNDYICTTADTDIVWKHFIKEFAICFILGLVRIQRTDCSVCFVSANCTVCAENMGLK